MRYKELTQKAREIVAKYPNLKYQVIDSLSLCKSEISEGSSEEHECELAWGCIEEIVADEKKKMEERI